MRPKRSRRRNSPARARFTGRRATSILTVSFRASFCRAFDRQTAGARPGSTTRWRCRPLGRLLPSRVCRSGRSIRSCWRRSRTASRSGAATAGSRARSRSLSVCGAWSCMRLRRRKGRVSIAICVRRASRRGRCWRTFRCPMVTARACWSCAATRSWPNACRPSTDRSFSPPRRPSSPLSCRLPRSARRPRAWRTGRRRMRRSRNWRMP